MRSLDSTIVAALTDSSDLLCVSGLPELALKGNVYSTCLTV